jgi:hypothetical protein
MFLLMPVDGFRYTKGGPRQFKRGDLERAVTREFCGDCGTQLITRRPGLNAIVLKAGTLDDPTQYGECQMAINASDRQAFNCADPRRFAATLKRAALPVPYSRMTLY